MNNIKAIYHAPQADYSLIRSLGFNYVEISVNAWPGSLEAIPDALTKVAEARMYPILDLGFGRYMDAFIIDWIKKNSDLLNVFQRKEIYYLPDEPNLRRISPSQIMLWKFLINQARTEVKTMAVLSSIRSVRGYENCADIIGVDYYKGFSDLWSLGKAVYAVIRLRLMHHDELVNVPGIRFSAEHIKHQAKFWPLISGSKNFFWYSWTPSQEIPAWFQSDVSANEELWSALRNVNA